MEKKTNQTIFSIFSLLLLFSSCVSAQLRTGFYQNSCPNVESIVRNAVRQKFQQTFVTAPATLRLFFHDCFVRVRNYIYMFFSKKKNYIYMSIGTLSFYFLILNVYKIVFIVLTV